MTTKRKRPPRCPSFPKKTCRSAKINLHPETPIPDTWLEAMQTTAIIPSETMVIIKQAGDRIHRTSRHPPLPHKPDPSSLSCLPHYPATFKCLNNTRSFPIHDARAAVCEAHRTPSSPHSSPRWSPPRAKTASPISYGSTRMPTPSHTHRRHLVFSGRQTPWPPRAPTHAHPPDARSDSTPPPNSISTGEKLIAPRRRNKRPSRPPCRRALPPTHPAAPPA